LRIGIGRRRADHPLHDGLVEPLGGIDLDEPPPPHRLRPDDEVGLRIAFREPRHREIVVMPGDVAGGIGIVLELGVDRALHEQHVERRSLGLRRRRQPPAAVAERRDHDSDSHQGLAAEHTGPPRLAPQSPPGCQPGRTDHHDAARAHGTRRVGNLDQRRPPPLRVAERGEREAAEHPAPQLLAGHP
jgi:hypothetical protein